MNEAKILLHFGTVDSDKTVRMSNIMKACKIIADILPNLDENYQIKDNMKELLPKLIKNLDILNSPITRLLNCFIEFYCRDELCISFLTDFATEFHERDDDEEKEEILQFIFEIIKHTPKEDLERADVQELLRDFMLSRYFSIRKEKRAIVQNMMQMIFDRIGRFIQLEEGVDYIKVKDNKIIMKGDESVESPLDDSGSAGFEVEATEADNVNMQIAQFNKSLKEEKMLERIERILNEGNILLSTNEKLLEFLRKKEYLSLLVTMVGKPHIYQSATTWMPKKEISLADPLLLDNYKNYTLENKSELFSYDFSKMNNIDYNIISLFIFQNNIFSISLNRVRKFTSLD